jgi:hypothetical protein
MKLDCVPNFRRAGFTLTLCQCIEFFNIFVWNISFDSLKILAVAANNHTQNSRTALALLRSQLVEPFNVVFGKVSEHASHDISISYHDIMSSVKLEGRLIR